MDEKTETLIRELADKFGTTAEHLWGVLVHQAPISASIDLLVMAGWLVLIVAGFRFINGKTTTPRATEEDRFPRADLDDEGAIFAWFIWGLGSIIALVIIGCSLSEVAAGLMNPEYWALQKVLP